MQVRRATKIVATLGPASSDPQLLEQMIAAGVNVVRLNFSHGDPSGQARRVRRGTAGAAFVAGQFGPAAMAGAGA